MSWESLLRVFASHARRGRNGIGPMRALLDARFGDGQIPMSAWSRRVAELLIDEGLATDLGLGQG